MAGKLFSVALPIGNVQDLGFRAREILNTADIIACEDTRKFYDFASRAGLSVQGNVFAYHAHNERASAEGILSRLIEGAIVALVSDAGTPRVSDPGYSLIRAAWDNGIALSPVPGASAVTALLSVSPFASEPILFLGFLSVKSGRRMRELEEYTAFPGVIVLYESVHRIEKTLEAIALAWKDRKLLIGRELTKTHEELFLGDPDSAVAWAKGKKGEFAILAGNPGTADAERKVL